MKDFWHKLWNVYRWTILVLVKPAILLWIIVNGIPPSIRAVGQVVNMCLKTLGK